MDVHRIAMNEEIAFHAHSSIENKKSRKYFDVALWYAHHDVKIFIAINVVDEIIDNVTRVALLCRSTGSASQSPQYRHTRQNMRQAGGTEVDRVV